MIRSLSPPTNTFQYLKLEQSWYYNTREIFWFVLHCSDLLFPPTLFLDLLILYKESIFWRPFETIQICFYNDYGPEDKTFCERHQIKNKRILKRSLVNDFVQDKTKKLNAQLACFKMGEETFLIVKTHFVFNRQLKSSFANLKSSKLDLFARKPPKRAPYSGKRDPVG